MVSASALALLVAALLVLALPTLAHAAPISDEEELVRFGSKGAGAGQFIFPGQMATDPVTGHLFLADQHNHRIDEFTPWGEFVKSFGTDVAPGAVNEVQEVRVRASTGQFKLKFEAESTASLPFDASASEVKAALEGLAKIGAGGVSVTEAASALDGTVPIVYVIAFKGSLAATDVAQLVAEDGATPLSGGVPSTSLLARTRADGHAATSGLESCTEESGCKEGLAGAGAGQFGEGLLTGIAVDAAGNLYIRDHDNLRVQKFDAAGRFLLMLGGEVDKTTKANICTAASGDECGKGVAGTGNGEFDAKSFGGLALCPAGAALCPAGALFAGDKGRIERFSLVGEYESQFEVVGPGGPGKPKQLAFDPVSEDLYVTFESKQGAYKLDSITGAEIPPVLKLNGGGEVVTDPSGDVFADSFSGEEGGTQVVREFDSKGSPLSPVNCCAGEIGADNKQLNFGGLATNAAGDLYASYSGIEDSRIRAFGPGPVSLEAPPKRPPEIAAQFAASVRRDGASVAAEINPHFWPDAHYFVQYGTGKCSEGGCEEELPASPALLSAKVSGLPLRSAAIALEGLSPGTTYHYRFVAESSGGGPVYGKGGGAPEEAGGETVFKEVGEESTFTTFEPLPRPPCPNDALRGGAGARLPDCRAYEMVSPTEKNNGDIRPLIDPLGYKIGLYQSSSDGEKLTYTSYRSFGDPESAPYVNQYIASREPEAGWQSEAISPPLGPGGVITESKTPYFENLFKGFSADLCQSWLMVAGEPGLAPGATTGYYDLYRREGCGAEGYEALIQSPPSGETNRTDFVPELQGTSADGRAAILRVADKLTPNAVGGKVQQAYFASEGEMRLLCVGTKGTASGGNCSAGTGGFSPPGYGLANRIASVDNALSEDGSRAYWTDSGANDSGPGKVFLRENPGAPESAKDGTGKCIPEAGKACTVKVSETKTLAPSRFLGAGADGSEALFEVTAGTLEGNLYRFTLGSGSTLIAGETLGVAGASEDLSHVYFVSREALAPGAVEGRPNLYLSHAGTSFIATLSEIDVIGGDIPSDTSRIEPIAHAARATADGRVLAFISTESPTGYDNADLASGKADSEVYRYDAEGGRLICVSCNPGGARPRGRVLKALSNNPERLPAAASLPLPFSNLHTPRALSADGQRIFFDSFDALLPRDTNGVEDVYEWEAAGSREECEEKGADAYSEANGGCLSLISSGESSQDSEFLDASVDGDDVFFTTSAGLLPQDSGLIDAYDARVEGGIPLPPAPPAACEGEACQSAPEAPNDPTPSSESFEGAGNVREEATAQRPKPCAKSKVRRRGRCVAQRHKRRHRQARRKRRAG